MTTSESEESWVSCFLGKPENEDFLRVPDSFLGDPFNHTDLTDLPYFEDAISMILDSDVEGSHSKVASAAEHLYGMIHVRYILSVPGLTKIKTNVENNKYGECPRYYCRRFPLVPYGRSVIPNQKDEYGKCWLNYYCGSCGDIYNTKKIDGAYFGPNLAPLLFLTFPALLPDNNEYFVPKIYGFKAPGSCVWLRYK